MSAFILSAARILSPKTQTVLSLSPKAFQVNPSTSHASSYFLDFSFDG